MVRPARVDDAEDLGAVHVRAWQRAYRGLMPDDYLNELSAAERASMWGDALQQPSRPRSARLVASIDHDTRVIGFAVVGPADSDPDTTTGELYAINVDPDHWGSGAGRALLRAVTFEMITQGFASAVLWVHPDNARARAFYERHGWASGAERREETVLGVTVPELRYRTPLPEA